MTTRRVGVAFAVLCLVFLASGCAPGGGSSTPDDPAGLFMGIWHGWMAPVSLIWGLFNSSIRVYEPINTGWWYDLGFYIAAIGGFGGISFLRKQRKGNG